MTEIVEGDESNLHLAIVDILEEFKMLFKEPQGLPPQRHRDHAIRLLPGSQTPNLRPYRYSYYQKNEIERLVREMLSAGVVRPSVSSFSSLVILVQKKDEGWQFCVEY